MLGTEFLAVLLAGGCTQVSSQPAAVDARPASNQGQAAAKAVSTNLDLESQLDHLVAQISTGMSGAQKTSVAVIEFSDLDGKVTKLGTFFSEELITRLFLTKKFNVIERQMLNKVLTEQKFQASGLVDDDSAKRLGKVLGVDALITGSFSDLYGHIRVNARMINAETGMVFGVASATIVKDESIRTMLGEKIDRSLVHSASVPSSSRDSKPVNPAAQESPNPEAGFSPWMDVESFKAELKKQWDNGFYSPRIEGREGSGRRGFHEYRATIQPFPKGHWEFHRGWGMVHADYEQFRDKMVAKGMKEISLQTYAGKDSDTRYQTCWLRTESD